MPPLAVQVTCDLCGKVSKSSAAHKHHMRAAHGQRNPARYCAGGSVCFGCQKDFVSRIRLVHHLSQDTKCARACADGLFPRISEETCLRLDAIDRIERSKARKGGRDSYRGPPVVYPV